jgi:hypothetical protein
MLFSLSIFFSCFAQPHTSKQIKSDSTNLDRVKNHFKNVIESGAVWVTA